MNFMRGGLWGWGGLITWAAGERMSGVGLKTLVARERVSGGRWCVPLIAFIPW